MINPLSLIGLSGTGNAGGAFGGIGGTAGAPAAAGTSFTSALADAASRTVGNLEHAERVSIQALQGGAETRDVVDAVMSAQQSLSAAIAIRDKIVSAYLDVSRMAI